MMIKNFDIIIEPFSGTFHTLFIELNIDNGTICLGYFYITILSITLFILGYIYKKVYNAYILNNIIVVRITILTFIIVAFKLDTFLEIYLMTLGETFGDIGNFMNTNDRPQTSFFGTVLNHKDDCAGCTSLYKMKKRYAGCETHERWWWYNCTDNICVIKHKDLGLNIDRIERNAIIDALNNYKDGAGNRVYEARVRGAYDPSIMKSGAASLERSDVVFKIIGKDDKWRNLTCSRPCLRKVWDSLEYQGHEGIEK